MSDFGGGDDDVGYDAGGFEYVVTTYCIFWPSQSPNAGFYSLRTMS